jgi:hypothetical protein
MNPIRSEKNETVRPVSLKFAHFTEDVTVFQVVLLSRHNGSVSFYWQEMAHKVCIALYGRVCDDVSLTADIFSGDTGLKCQLASRWCFMKSFQILLSSFTQTQGCSFKLDNAHRLSWRYKCNSRYQENKRNTVLVV